MSECTHDCGSCSANCSERKQESLVAQPHKDSHIKKVIGVVSGKGGVNGHFHVRSSHESPGIPLRSS